MVQTAQKTLRQLPFMINYTRYELPKNYTVRPEYIINRVCTYFSITEKQIMAKNRTRMVNMARMIAMTLIYELCQEQSLKSVGRMFNRDHTTVMNARQVVNDLTEGPTPIWKQHYDYFKKQFN